MNLLKFIGAFLALNIGTILNAAELANAASCENGETFEFPRDLEREDLIVLELMYELEKNQLEQELETSKLLVASSNPWDRIRKRIRRLGDMIDQLREWARALCTTSGREAYCASKAIQEITRCLHDPDVSDCWDGVQSALSACCRGTSGH